MDGQNKGLDAEKVVSAEQVSDVENAASLSPALQSSQPAQDLQDVLEQILQSFREQSLNLRAQGTKFEHLMLQVFKTAKVYKAVYADVQMYHDWAAQHPELHPSKTDIGIDLVATLKTPEGTDGKARFVAIQCKFYQKDTSVPKADIDSFLSASSTAYFASRILVATNRGWSNNTRQTFLSQEKPIQVLSLETLKQLDVDWSCYQKEGLVQLKPLRQLRDYQQEAVRNVCLGFQNYDRGKLIMACGTGKTFTSLKIAEKQAAPHGLVLFLVPSLSLLSQTMNDWVQQSEKLMTAIPVCSDSSIGSLSSMGNAIGAKKSKEDANDDLASLFAMHDLAYPATTNAQDLAARVQQALKRSIQDPDFGLTVVFSTYQSIQVVHDAQDKYGLPDFALIICDEAHRTAGSYFVGDKPNARKNKAQTQAQQAQAANGNDEESAFTKVHDAAYVKGSKRLYMTATPKIYGEAPKQQEQLGDVVLYSMDDESVFGPVFYALNFDMAVKLGCLVDYKVLILVSDANVFITEDQRANFSQNQIARVLGTWKALNKYGVDEDFSGDEQPMKRALAFAQRISLEKMRSGLKKDCTVASKEFAQGFQDVVDKYRDYLNEAAEKSLQEYREPSYEYTHLLPYAVDCSCKHIDGSMDSVEKSQILSWLREEPAEKECKVLFNVRCLSEGVDVPSLDAVAFLSPRKSMVEVVQIVGRVMRTAPHKKRGYVIIPVITTNINEPQNVLLQSDEFKVVWEVLNALKSINPNQVLVDSYLQKLDSRIAIICTHGGEVTKRSSGNGSARSSGGDDWNKELSRWSFDEQTALIEEKIKAIIIKKVGNRRDWEDWAQDVGQICTKQVAHIREILDSPTGNSITANSSSTSVCAHAANQQAFAAFKQELTAATGVKLSDDDVIEMLAQHIVIKPVLDELFRGYAFTEKNAIARSMSRMVERLDQEGLTKANAELKGFYTSVGLRMKNVTTLEDRQKVIVELFDRFFKVAFPKQQEKLGIVYTPVEVVDFILRSVNDLLKQEFGCNFGSHNVHILDPFTGTGTFISRLLQQELISPQELDYKYRNELHAFEILPLAYYVASINIEATYTELYAKYHGGQALAPEDYQANNVTVLTDTFSGAKQTDFNFVSGDPLGENYARRKAIEQQELRVIIGNPPYSVGQNNQNDDNQNESYPELDARIEGTYVAQAGKVTNKNSLYDSYIRAFRWASDKITERGVIAFVTNAGWLDSAAASGMRHCLQEEFSAVYVYHLKGNARTSGEQRRKEKDNVFGVGSRAPIAITISVKNSEAQEQGKIYFASVDDYLSREEKLGQLVALGSIMQTTLTEIKPDSHGDWLHQRRNDFAKFISLNGKDKGHEDDGVFANYSTGIKSSRDVWSFNSSASELQTNFVRCIANYNEQLEKSQQARNAGQVTQEYVLEREQTKIKWSRSLENYFKRNLRSPAFNAQCVVATLYRPYVKQKLYNEKFWLTDTSQMPQIFPFVGAENLAIGVSDKEGAHFSCLMSDCINDLHSVGDSQWFPRYLYRPVGEAKRSTANPFPLLVDDGDNQDTGSVVINGYIREDALQPAAIAHFQQAYAGHEAEVNADSVFYYIYGLLHSPDYRCTYQNNLQKELPRIPRVAEFADFMAFVAAGKQLADLHVNYEKVEPYDGCNIQGFNHSSTADALKITQLKYGKIAGKKGAAGLDKSTIVYNSQITISNIPLEAQDYVVNKKSALDWLVERCGISIDKDSKIVNDFNAMAEESGDPQYILNLILRVITVSLETNKIVAALPKLKIHPLDQ